MSAFFMQPRPRWAILVGSLLLSVLPVPTVQAQLLPWRRSADTCPPAPCPTVPQLQPVPAPPQAAPTPTPEQQTPVPPAPQAGEEPSFSPERFAATGGESVALATPNMIGDLLGPFALLATGPTPTARTPRSPLVPFFARGAFKISENESPRPQDRILFDYNYFSGVGEPNGLANAQIHREVIGFEKTFLDQRASIGMRLPFFETAGDGSLSTDGVGDLTIILKYALLEDRSTGDVLSGGLVVTAPTGQSNLFDFNGVKIHDTLLQPWAGFYVGVDNWYIHGFLSLVVPTDSRDSTILFNDIGIGYWLYRGHSGLISGVAPTIEAHVTTPLNHRDSDANPFVDPIFFPDWVDLTGGVCIDLRNHSSLLLGVSTPVTGPKPFDVEAVVELNIRF
jgi:hypothetical protein